MSGMKLDVSFNACRVRVVSDEIFKSNQITLANPDGLWLDIL